VSALKYQAMANTHIISNRASLTSCAYQLLTFVGVDVGVGVTTMQRSN